MFIASSPTVKSFLTLVGEPGVASKFKKDYFNFSQHTHVEPASKMPDRSYASMLFIY